MKPGGIILQRKFIPLCLYMADIHAFSPLNAVSKLRVVFFLTVIPVFIIIVRTKLFSNEGQVSSLLKP